MWKAAIHLDKLIKYSKCQ